MATKRFANEPTYPPKRTKVDEDEALAWKNEEALFALNQKKLGSLTRYQNQRPTILDYLYILYIHYCRATGTLAELRKHVVVNPNIAKVSDLEDRADLTQFIDKPLILIERALKNEKMDEPFVDQVKAWVELERDIQSDEDKFISPLRFWKSVLAIAYNVDTTYLNLLHEPVLEDLNALLNSQTLEELQDLRIQTMKHMKMSVNIDEEYNMLVIKRIDIISATKLLDMIYEGSECSEPVVAEEPKEVVVDQGMELYKREANKPMEADEEEYNQIYPLNLSSDDMKVPMFYNRVGYGFEWNKYNLAHYTLENPPPKVVQQYKFNIFFPDLPKRTTPSYYLKNSDNPDVQIIVFRGGPPYGDIAFKIVNKEWEHSHKKGFKKTFVNGVLQLWFSFKKYKPPVKK